MVDYMNLTEGESQVMRDTEDAIRTESTTQIAELENEIEHLKEELAAAKKGFEEIRYKVSPSGNDLFAADKICFEFLKQLNAGE